MEQNSMNELTKEGATLVSKSNKGKVVAAIKTGKWKTAFLMVGISLTLFGNIPFVFLNISVNKLLLWLAAILAVISAVEYYTMNKKLIDTK